MKDHQKAMEESALQNPFNEKRDFFKKSLYIVIFAELDYHLAMETLM